MPQKKRTKKVSNGTAVGARPTRLTELQKVLLGGGALRRFAPVGSKNQGR